MSLNKDLTLAKNLAVWLVKEGADSALVDMQDTGVFTVSYVFNGKEQPTTKPSPSRKAPTPISS